MLDKLNNNRLGATALSGAISVKETRDAIRES
jgi:hypothetical protein